MIQLYYFAHIVEYFLEKATIFRKLDVKIFDFYNRISYHPHTIKNYDVKLFKYYELWKKLLILLKRLLGILLFL